MVTSSGTGSAGGSADCPRSQCHRPTNWLLSAQAALVANPAQSPVINVMPRNHLMAFSSSASCAQLRERARQTCSQSSTPAGAAGAVLEIRRPRARRSAPPLQSQCATYAAFGQCGRRSGHLRKGSGKSGRIPYRWTERPCRVLRGYECSRTHRGRDVAVLFSVK
jgi:hypothetical protein